MKVVLIPPVEMKYFPSEFNEMLSSLCGFPQNFPLRGVSRQVFAKEKTQEVSGDQAEAIEASVAVQELNLCTGKGPEP